MMDDDFRQDLETLINEHSIERGCDTPDFILATYLAACLTAFDAAVTHREQWYGRRCGNGVSVVPPAPELVNAALGALALDTDRPGESFGLDK